MLNIIIVRYRICSRSYIFKSFMPPKKQEQKVIEYKPCFVLPIFLSGPKSRSAVALAHPVTIKKNIDNAKVIEILKDKGLEQHIVNGQINEKGRKFVCENLKLVCDQFVGSLSKPADPKKDAKKDAKKQAKKQQPVAQTVIPPIQITNDKNCNDFFLFLSGPSNEEELELALSKQTRIDIVVVIKEKVMPGSRKPNYDLLNNQKTFEDIASTLKSTKIDPNLQKKDHDTIDYNKIGRQLTEAFTTFKSKLKNQSPYKNTIILQISYLDNLSNPESNQNLFIQTFFDRLCKCTLELEQYNQWRSTRKLVPMIEPIKQITTKQVQVEDKNDKGKKGGKAEPVFETVQQIVEKKFEDFPENIRSDLKDYFVVKNVKKNQKERKNTLPKDDESVYKQILTDCLISLPKNPSQKVNAKRAEEQTYKDYINELSSHIRNDFQLKPLNKMTCENIVNKLRSVNYWRNISMNSPISFEFTPIATSFSFMELAQKFHNSTQELQVEYIIRKIENMAKKANPKIQWSFQDRKFVEKLTKQQLKSVINQELLHDPQIYTGRLVTENLNLLILSRTNPPGRVLYHNQIFQWKVLPDFQKWSDCFLGKDGLKKQEFFDYPFQEAGNLAVKIKNMMPVDNTVIKHEMHTIGDRKTSIVQFQKYKHTFGLSKKTIGEDNQKIYVYWHDIEDQYRLRIFRNKKPLSSTNAQQEEKNKNNAQIKGVTVQLENKGKYIVAMDPTPTIHWRFPNQERIRKIGSLGEVTSYRTDGSILIYHPNGDISTFRNGKWSRTSSKNGEVKIEALNQGEDSIKIREDQTIFVTDAKGNQKTIFPDGTQLLQKVKQRIREIKNPNGPFIRIYLPRDYNLNVIGHGSAFAYLGFKDILERSYDGYLFEFIDQEISSHFYTERYDKNGVIQTEQMRLITYKDSSIMRINSREAKIVFNSPSQNTILNESTINERWLQTFTTEANHGEGVFDIDLEAGYIENKDSQTNKFVAKVDERSQAHIAVSFITEDEDDAVSNFPSGFHIKQQNYFLPPPANRIPPRIFSISQDGSGCEYLNKQQVESMQQYSVVKEHVGNKTVIQYCCQEKPQPNYMNITFSKQVNLQAFGLPDVLKTVSSKQNLIPVHFNNVRHRLIEEINWDSNYTNVKNLQSLLEEETNKKKMLKESRRKAEKPIQKN